MKKIICALCVGFLCILCINSKFESTEAAFAKSVIRLHVLANSNTDEDQSLKLKVRDEVISKLKPLFDENGDISAARNVIEESIPKIKKCAEDVIKKNGYSYSVNVSLGKSDFPTKSYGDLVLPAGSYDALKVEIGAAEGHNWWCVLFPPLCFVDETCVSGDTKAAMQIEKTVGEENSSFIKKEKDAPVELKFKVYEIWQSGKQKLACLFK